MCEDVVTWDTWHTRGPSQPRVIWGGGEALRPETKLLTRRPYSDRVRSFSIQKVYLSKLHSSFAVLEIVVQKENGQRTKLFPMGEVSRGTLLLFSSSPPDILLSDK